MKKACKMEKKRMVIVIVSVILLLAVIGVSAYWGIPVGLIIDKDSVQKIETNVQKFEAGTYGDYMALGKVDAEGNLTDEPFKIITFTDLHLDTYFNKGARSISHMIENIKAENPDLVILTGDIVTSSTNWLRVKQFGKLMDELGVYWCTVLGNHEGDNWRSIKREKFVDVWSSFQYCLMHDDPDAVADGVWGNGNYVINLVKSGGAITQSLIFMDSGNRVSKQDAERLNISKESYDYIKPSQIKWYRGVISKLEAMQQEQPILSMLYIHIPLQEYADAYNIVTEEQLEEGQTASDNETLYVCGKAYEKVSASDYNSGLFATLVEEGHTQAVFCGHDHINNFIIQYQGIYLVYVQKGGYSSYDMATRGLGEENQGYTNTVVNADGSIGITHFINK
ncbi:MAG: metallophosphoesterase [Clostridia bacterium]|nr:metallophosphoesterase [Clostridia bacterium]